MSSDYNKKYFLGFVLALSAGLIWSFGAPTVRHMVDAQIYQWHYLFCRGLTVATILLIFLLYKEGFAFRHNFKRVGLSGLLGGVALAFAFIFFIFGMTYTSAATTLFMIGTQPLFAGLFAYIFLREYVRAATLIACVISLGGMFIMAYSDWQSGTFMGWVFGLFCSVSFATFAVTLRWQPDTPKFTTIMISGVTCALFSVIMILIFSENLTMPTRNILLSILHGSFVASGLILLSIGSKYLPAAEFMLLSLTEVVGGVIWCWIPLFGVNEVPESYTLIGGLVIIFSIAFHAIGTRQRPVPPTL
ncbi:MAG: DMT family transporter [Pelagibacterales bacterium]|nr:DMT family transporter [Pelagibacterales bacterium]